MSRFVSQGEGGAVTGSDLSHRYLWQPAAVDQLLADEQLLPLASVGEGQEDAYDLTQPGDVLWALTDHLGTVRDLAAYDSTTGATTVVNHRVYDSFGNLESQSNAAVDCLFGFTGRPVDASTGLQNNLNRWYDAKTGDWMSPDPTGFNASDTNTYRYCGNNPENGVDSAGLVGIFFDGAGQPPGRDTVIQHLYYNYDGATAIWYTHIWPNNIWSNINEAVQYITDMVAMDADAKVDIFGWSRGAVAALTVAKILGKKGINVRFLGLIDPCAMGGLQMVGTNDTEVPDNVFNTFEAKAGERSFFQPSRPSVPIYGDDQPYPIVRFPYKHETIGFEDKVYRAMRARARAAGVPLNSDNYPTEY